MKSGYALITLFAIALCPGTSVRAWPQSSPGSANKTCLVKVAGVQTNCPPGWKIVEETHRGSTIGNFDRPDKTGDLATPVGRATIAIYSMPGLYRNFKEWVYAATKNAPDAVQTNKTLTNKAAGSINIFCFTPPDSQRGWIYQSYFFEINGIPVNVE